MTLATIGGVYELFLIGLFLLVVTPFGLGALIAFRIYSMSIPPENQTQGGKVWWFFVGGLSGWAGLMILAFLWMTMT